MNTQTASQGIVQVVIVIFWLSVLRVSDLGPLTAGLSWLPALHATVLGEICRGEQDKMLALLRGVLSRDRT